MDPACEHRDQQHREREAAGADWQNSGYVFTRPNGAPIEGATLTRHFTALLRRTKLRRIRFHDLRHSAATLLLEQGIELAVNKEILGHAHIGATAAVYGHVRLRLRHQAIGTLSNALRDPADDTAAPDGDDDPPLCAQPSADVPSTVAVKTPRSPADDPSAGLLPLAIYFGPNLQLEA